MESLNPTRPKPASPRGHGPLLKIGALLLVLIPLLWAAWKWWQGATVPNQRDEPALDFVTPYRNVHPDVQYVGDAVCARCHSAIAKTYRQHPMGRSLAPVSSQIGLERYDARSDNPFEKFGSLFLVEGRGDRVFHKRATRDVQGRIIAEAVNEIQFVIGSGSHGHSYLMNHNGYLFQSPISWFSQEQKWDLSPGAGGFLQASRPINARCLFCHCNQARAVEHSVNQYQTPIFQGYAIGCERCHGPGQLHAESRARGDVLDGVDPTIVNPRRLEFALREAVCEQCHLQGEVRVLRRGRQTFDFRPGLPLYQFWSVFVRQPEFSDNYKAVSQVEQLHRSRCFRESNQVAKKGTQLVSTLVPKVSGVQTGSKRAASPFSQLGCISCHDPHQLPAAEKKVAYYRDRCLTCHKEKTCSLSPVLRKQQTPDDSCVACHMPRSTSSNIAHTALTDHRILRRPDDRSRTHNRPPRPLSPGEAPVVHFHREEAGSRDDAVARDLALALVELARSSPTTMSELGRIATPLLDAAVQEAPEDVPAWEGKAYALWLQGRAREALAAYETTLVKSPRREIALVDSANLAEGLNQPDVAIALWQRVIAVNPWIADYHYQLAKLLARRQDWQKAVDECHKAVPLNPTSVPARLLLITCCLRSGKKEQARAEFELVLALNPAEEEVLRRWYAEQTP